jgi:hypothetical protein
MTSRSPARRYLPMRVTPSTYALLAELAERETGGNVSRMVRRLVREALVTRRAVTQAGQPQNRRGAGIAMDSASNSGASRSSSAAGRSAAGSTASAGRGGSVGGHAGSVLDAGALAAPTGWGGLPPTIPSGYRLSDEL